MTEFRTIKIVSKTYDTKEMLVSPDKYRLVVDGGPSWYPLWSHTAQTFYAVRNNRRPDGKRLLQKAHRLITNCPPDLYVAHLNHNGLNNRDDNLWGCTPTQSMGHTRKRKDGVTSQYKGMSWTKACHKWQAQICIHGRAKFLGYFDDERDAARAYDRFGDLAYTNGLFVPHHARGGIEL
jgi:hypothetical protein